MAIVKANTNYATDSRNPDKVHTMVSDPEPLIRQTICNNPCVTTDDLRILANDPVPYVAATAKRVLRRKSG